MILAKSKGIVQIGLAVSLPSRVYARIAYVQDSQSRNLSTWVQELSIAIIEARLG